MMAVDNAAKRSSNELPVAKETKKRRVEFVDAQDGQKMRNSEENAGFSMKLYSKYVKNALEDLDGNDASQIDTLASQLSLGASDPLRISPENFTVLLRVLSNNISKIDTPTCTSLIHSVISFEKWWELPATALSTYIFFVKILCSSLPKWWQEVSYLLISNFVLPPEKTQQHHEMLRYFLRTTPSSTAFINSDITKLFPNKNDTKRNLLNYTSNLLILTDYCKELRFQCWSLIVEKVISIDVELQNELDELDDDLEEDIDDELDDAESAQEDAVQIMNVPNSDDEDESDREADEIFEGEEEYNVEISQNIKELSFKLDAILALITKKLSQSLTPESLDSGDGVAIFNTLVSLFRSHILPTYYTKSIQYIMFHVSQQQPELMDAFLVTLIDIAFTTTEIIEKRIKALQYIGSFIARAKKLTNTQIIFVASYLTSWLNRYVLEREEEVTQHGGVERFKHFYAAFQALCYIFCFRHAVFRNGDKWECDLDKFFQWMVLSKFNPLKYCNENVMMMFARIAQHEGLVYCFSIIENNNNERLRGITGKAKTEGSSSSMSNWTLATRQQFIDLQSYFPYDPLFLKTYKRMMREYYIEWSDVSREYESDESEELDDINKES
ncbi:LAMI_0G04940g1_1 [Lachancea mirantina]|uniref:LAMI_0G04940g1_1 n=1 Tax=Lachancea mirantina TaxID=1230905 RepID=A0A1G4K8R1_9SACH|nr:LAMI_0G04940g1_1 [Lachancea mirantina]